MKTTPEQRSFASGEIDPLLWRRADYLRAQTGLATCRGFLPLAQGGFTRAPGTILRGSTRGNGQARLIPFVFAANDAVVLEFSAGKMRVWRYGALVTTGAGDVFELATPYDWTSVQALSYVQSADVIYLADGTQPVQRLARYALDNWTIEPQDFARGPFRPQNVARANTVQASAGSGAITLTASFDAFVASDVGSLMMLRPSDNSLIPLWEGNRNVTVGDRMRYGANVYELVAGTNTGVNPPIHESGVEMVDDRPTKWRWVHDDTGIVRITAVATATSASADVVKTVPQGCVDDPTYRWARGAWSPRFGYPAKLELFDQRLVAAATPTEPRTVWFSTVGDYDNFLPGTKADESFAYALGGESTVNRIVNLCRGRMGLHIFALGEEYASRSETRAQVIGPTTAVFELIGSNGASPARPVVQDGDPIYITRDKARLMRLAYSLEADSARGSRLSLPAQHIAGAGIEELAWQSMPTPTVWMRRSTGDLAAMIHDPSEEVLGWATLSLAGGAVESICASPDASGTGTIITMVVRRVISDSVKRFVEELAPTFGMLTGAADPAQACHLFAAVQIDSEAGLMTISLPHLVGQTVHAWTDQGGFGPFTVPEDGDVVLPVAVHRGWIGLLDESHVAETLPVQASAPNGSTAGQAMKLSGAAFALHQTCQGLVGVNTRTMPQGRTIGPAQPVIPLPIGSSMADALSGLVQRDLMSGGATEIQIAVYPSGGAPITVLSITPNIRPTGG